VFYANIISALEQGIGGRVQPKHKLLAYYLTKWMSIFISGSPYGANNREPVFGKCLLAQNSRSTLIRIPPRNTSHMSTLVTVDLVTLTIFHHTHSILLTDAAFVRFGSLAFGEAWHFMR
jgi:pantothenate kinase